MEPTPRPKEPTTWVPPWPHPPRSASSRRSWTPRARSTTGPSVRFISGSSPVPAIGAISGELRRFDGGEPRGGLRSDRRHRALRVRCRDGRSQGHVEPRLYRWEGRAKRQAVSLLRVSGGGHGRIRRERRQQRHTQFHGRGFRLDPVSRSHRTGTAAQDQGTIPARGFGRRRRA